MLVETANKNYCKSISKPINNLNSTKLKHLKLNAREFFISMCIYNYSSYIYKGALKTIYKGALKTEHTLHYMEKTNYQ